MNLQLVASQASQLFSLPEICVKLQDLIYNPDSSMADIAPFNRHRRDLLTVTVVPLPRGPNSIPTKMLEVEARDSS